jgi:hypothetical protein
LRRRANRVEEERRGVREGLRVEGRVRRLFGRASAVFGMAVALAGELTLGGIGPAGPAGIMLGALGYVLGARGLGAAALALSATEILLGLAAG